MKNIDMIANIKDNLREIKYVCTTADIWSSFRRSFLGMTIHWIDQNFNRQSKAISCTRLQHPHTYIHITRCILEIHNRFDLTPDKVVCMVTDNGSNFVKAFQKFHYNIQESATDEKNADNEEETETLQFDSVCNIFDEVDSPERYYNLPQHHRCSSHTLNLIASTDSIKICETDATYKEAFKCAMSKCSTLWSKTNRSGSKASETYRDIVGRASKTPCQTRWNSLYDSIVELLKAEAKLFEITKALNIASFTFNDIEFLKEYIDCMQPIAYALDKLQGENMFLGDVYPWIFAIQNNLENIRNIRRDTNNSLKYCEPLRQQLISSLKTRFHNLFTFSEHAKEYIIATVSHPAWKFRWIPNDMLQEGRNNIKDIVLHALKEMATAETSSASQSSTSQSSFSHNSLQDVEKANFFSFMENFSTETEDSNIIEVELLQYLNDKDSRIQSILKYKHMKQLFLKYNTTIPSSAPVERLFSFAGLILRPRRSNLTDQNFERCTLLNANSSMK